MLIELLFEYVYDRKFISQLLATVITYSAIRVTLFYRARKRRFQLLKYYGYPGPEPNLFNGNLSDFLKAKPQAYKMDTIFRATYGKVYAVYFGDAPCLRVTDLELLKKIFFDHSSKFKMRTCTFIKTPIVHGILFCSYDRWKVFRRIMSPLFSSYTVRGASSTMFIEDSIKLMIDYIDTKLIEAKERGKEANIDMHDLMKSTALHMISSMAVKLPNVQVKENEGNVKSLDSYLSQCDQGAVVYALMFPFFNRILTFIATHFEHNKTLGLIRRGLEHRIDETIKSYSKLTDTNNGVVDELQLSLIDLLIKLCHEGKITRKEVLANAESVLFAGYDTTSTTLTYVFWVLGKYEQIQDKLRQELMAHGIESHYLEQVINETMRLYPTVMHFTTRMATETVIIDDRVIPQGTIIVHHNWLMNRDPEIWPEPEKFDTERFREGIDIHPCAFAPFGIGERKCLGYKLAYLEMKLILCDILLKYRLKLKAPQELELVSYANILSKPRDKVILGLEPL